MPPTPWPSSASSRRRRPRPSGRSGSAAKFDVARIDAIEREVKHDVIAFLTHLAEIVGPEARFVHQGMTSSDVLDTCLAVQLVRAADLLIGGRRRAAGGARSGAPWSTSSRPPSAAATASTPSPPPSASSSPTPMPSSPAPRHGWRRRREEVATCAISGAVGTFANIDPRVEAYVAGEDGADGPSRSRPRSSRATATPCTSPPWAWSPRRSSGWRPRSATCSAPRCWRPRSSSREGQKGSSAMPHKRNPVLTENLTGLARLVRAYALPAMENVALWHERDISHSSVERMIGPDATVTLDFALARMAGVVDKLVVYPENMQQEPRPAGRARALAARAAGADPEGGRARGRLPPGAAQRHAGVAAATAISSRC